MTQNLDPELFEITFFQLYENFGYTCLCCTQMHLDVNHKPGEPMAVRQCNRCNKTIDEEMAHWAKWHRHYLIWDTAADPRHFHKSLTFGTLDTFLQVVPLQYQYLFLDRDNFLLSNQLAELTGGRKEVCFCDQCFTPEKAVKDVQMWCANIMAVEEQHEDFSEHYFKALKLSKALPQTLQEDYFRRIEFDIPRSPLHYAYQDIPDDYLQQVNGQCVICAKDFKQRGYLFLFPNCNHVFHTRCAESWLALRDNCPLCRKAFGQ